MNSAAVKDTERPEPSYDLEAAILAALLHERVTKSLATKEIGLPRVESLWLACLDYFVSRLPATTREAIQRSGLPAHLLPTAIPQQTKTGVLPLEILLLVLEPSEDPSAIVKCRLCTARPEPIPRPRYRVLSYDWGNPAKTRCISLSGTATEVTKNLESGLRYLRQQHEPCCLWVDPLCIDHRHGQTRGSSTEALRYIYARAQEVIVWLGDESETSARAFRCVNHLATEDIAAQCFLVQHELHHPDLHPESPFGLGAFMKLMERRWWDRAGLVQQLMQGCKVTVHCGGSSADWNSFTRLFEVLQEKEPMVRNRNVRYLRKVFQAVYVVPLQVFENLPPAMSIEERPINPKAFFLSIERSFKGAKLGVSWVLALSKVASLCGSVLTGLAEKLCNRNVDRIRMALFQDPTLHRRGEGRRSPEEGAEAFSNGFPGRTPSAPATLSGLVSAETHRKQRAIESTFLAADSHHQSELQCWLRVLRLLPTSHARLVAPAEQVAAGSPFIYEPLDPTAKEFRILLLKSIAETNGQPDSRVDCELIPADLNLLSRLGIRKCPFVSISRDWGELVSEAPIFVHGREKAINSALYADLRNLRHPSDDTLFWVPPICIDQDNAQEKALQANLKTLVDQHSGYMWSEDDDLEVESSAYTPTFCVSCKTLPWNEILVEGIEEGPCAPIFSPRLATVRESSASGCHLCSLVWHSLQFGSSSNLISDKDPFSMVPLSEQCGCIRAHTCSVYIIQENSESLKVFAHCKGAYKGAAGHVASLPLSASAFEANLHGHGELRESTNRKRSRFRFASIGFDQLAQTWIDDCCQNHANCGPATDYPLPTRVICVGHDNQDSYLMISNGAAGKWISLSYCWGTVETLKTTADNLEDHKKRIPLEKLPLTIRDAIMITRSLGIKYLWVDALCIIQGSKEDWTKESARIADVYRNSIVTIATSSATDVQGSCFLGRNGLANLPCPISFEAREGVRLTRWIHGARGVSWSDKIIKSPLQQRGWTLQEGQLSIRVLHYSDSELLWQCREGVRRELAASDIVTADDPLVTRRMFDAFSVVPRNVFSRWYHLVGEFTARRLTFETDKLPAISGMAAEVARFIKARSRRRLATKEEAKMSGRSSLWKGNGKASGDRSAWFLMHLMELAKGKATPGLEELPFDAVSDRLLSRYMGSDIDPWPGKQVAHNACCDECFERIRGMRHKCKVCPDFDYCNSCIAKADALHPLHEFTQIFRVDSPKPDDGTRKPGESALKPIEDALEPGEDILESDGDASSPGAMTRAGPSVPDTDRDSEPKVMTESFADDDARLEDNNSDGVAAELYVYAEEDRFPSVKEWPTAVTDGDYLAGLWRADLIKGLTWHVNHDAHHEPGKEAVIYRAPSWSWASVGGQVRYEADRLTYLRPEGTGDAKAHVQNCRVTRAGSNEYGAVSDGELTLLAPITEMPYYCDKNGSGQPVRKQNVKGDIVSTESLHLDHEPPYLPFTAKCARLDTFNCLILEPAGNAKKQVLYRRIGIWSCDNLSRIGFDNMTSCHWESKVVTII